MLRMVFPYEFQGVQCSAFLFNFRVATWEPHQEWGPSEILEWFWLLFVLFTNCLNFQNSTNINQPSITDIDLGWVNFGEFWSFWTSKRKPNGIQTGFAGALDPTWELGGLDGGVGRDLQGKWKLEEIKIFSIIYCFIFQTYHIRFYVLMTCFILFHHILLCFAGWLTQFYHIFWHASRDKKQWWACLQNGEPPDLWWGPLLYVQSIKWELRGPDYYVLAHPCPVSASNIQKSDGWRCKRDYFVW